MRVSNVLRAPQITRYTSGTGTYTTPSGARYLRVKMCGGGGGGYAGGNNNTGSTHGADSTFGTSLLTASLGQSGGGVGGATTVTSPAISIIQVQGTVAEDSDQIASSTGGLGGFNALGGSGKGGVAISGVGAAARANTGAGGGGGGPTAVEAAGTGGSAGGYLEALIPAPLSATYAYTVGAGGTGASALGNGGAGGSGVIVVEAVF